MNEKVRRLTLEFTAEDKPVEVEQVTFCHDLLEAGEKITTAADLQWSTGVAAFALLAVRTRQNSDQPAYKLGGAPAKSLYIAMNEKPKWQTQMIGCDSEGKALFRKCIRRHCTKGRTEHSVQFYRNFLDPTQIAVMRGGRDISGDADALEKLATDIENRDLPDQRHGRSDASPPPPARHIRIALLLSGYLEYTSEIAYHLRRGLETACDEDGISRWTVSISAEAGPTGRFCNPDVSRNWTHTIDKLLRAQGDRPFDAYFSIGTQASIALQKRLGDDFGKVPFIFLGVTDAEFAGLVPSLQHRGDEQVAGVAYGTSLGNIASRIRKLFPSHQLAFVYENGTPQDEAATAMLKKNPRIPLLIKEVTDGSALQALDDENTVYFTWYTFGHVFNQAARLPKRRLVVASTRRAVEAGCAIAGVGGNYRQIGEDGAGLLINHLINGTPLGTIDIVIPHFCTWINCDVAAASGIRFPPDALSERDVELFGDVNAYHVWLASTSEASDEARGEDPH